MASYVLKEMPDVHHEGNRKVFPKLETYSQKSLDDLVKYVRGHGAPFSAGTIEGVVTTLMEAAVVWLSNGHTVKIDGLGTLSLSLGFSDEKGNEMQNETDRMGYRHVEVRTVKFRPDVELVKQLRSRTDLVRQEAGVQKHHRQQFTQEERMAQAIQRIEQHGFITLTDYANMNSMSRSMASRELKAFEADPACPIKAKGTAPHKVWCLEN
jgi:predicted histone-like DNA-binding protein